MNAMGMVLDGPEGKGGETTSVTTRNGAGIGPPVM